MTKYNFIILSFILCFATSVEAQEGNVLTFDRYMQNVKENNIDYLIEQYNVDIADAQLNAAKVFPDPELSVSYTNNQEWDLQMGYGIDVELAYTFELGGKRSARIQVARSEKEMTEALLEDFFRSLRAEAAIAYYAALKQQKVHEIQRASYLRMLALAEADSVRYRLGAITETDARQSRLEAASILNELYASEGELEELLVQLLLMQGSKDISLAYSIEGEIPYRKHSFDLQELIATAQDKRADLRAAIKSKEMSQSQLRLAKANRAIDLGLSIGGSYSSEVRNEIAPAPAFKGITAGISVPLKFSNTNRGELKAAQALARQSELEHEAIERRIAAEVVQAHNKYRLACRQVDQFHDGLLADAGFILDKKIYNYERGETSILEVLDAQRTYNEVQVSYIELLYDCALALIELEQATGK